MRLLSAIDHLFLTRPVVLVPVWGFSVFGFCRAQLTSGESFLHLWQTPHFNDYLWALIFSLSVAAVYVINQIADYEVDARNGGLPLLHCGKISKQGAWVVTAITTILSIMLPILYREWVIAACSISGLVLGTIYSCKPVRLSGRPVADFISNALGYGLIAFGVGWSLGGRSLFSADFFICALPYFFLMCAGSISSTVPDIDGDRVDRKFTTAVVFGAYRSNFIAALLIVVALIISFFIHDWIGLLCSIASIPIYILYLIKPSQKSSEATYKIGGGLMMLIAGVCIPVFILAGVLVFSSTWLYFRLRHHVSYPSLVPVKNA